MKNILSIFLCLVLVLSVSDAFSQLSKAEKKEWKNKAKEYKKNPELLKDLVDENNSLQGQVTSLKGQIAGLQSRIADKDSEMSSLQDELSRAKSMASNCQSEVSQLKAQMAAGPGPSNWNKGVAFKVQIGAFKNKDLSDYFENNEVFGGETDENGIQKITLGVFRDYRRADTFKKYLREMGVKDAWITPYRDGTRVDIKEVLDNVTTGS
jgi:hypothetical protein